MALTRKLLKGMGLTDEQVDTIIEAHTDTVDGLKADIGRYKADAEKLPGIQKELDDLKKEDADGGYKAKYEKEKKDFQDFKDGVAAKESAADSTPLGIGGCGKLHGVAGGKPINSGRNAHGEKRGSVKGDPVKMISR